MFGKKFNKGILSRGRNLAIESLEDRNLLSAVTWGTPTFDNINDTVTFTATYNCDAEAENITELKITGFYNNGDYDIVAAGGDTYANNSFTNVADMGLTTPLDVALDKIVKNDTSEGGLDNDSSTQFYYELKWNNFVKPTDSVDLYTVTCHFDLSSLSDGEKTNINLFATENTGTSKEIGNKTFTIINENDTLKLYTKTINLDQSSLTKYVSDFTDISTVNPMDLATVTTSDFDNSPVAFTCTINNQETPNFVVTENNGTFQLQAVGTLAEGEYAVTIKAAGVDDIFTTFRLTVNADPVTPTITLDQTSATKLVSDFMYAATTPITLATVTASDFATAPTSFICTIGSETTDNFNVVNDEGVFRLQAIQALTAGSYTVTVKAEGNDEVSAAFTLTVNADPTITLDQTSATKLVSEFVNATATPITLATVTVSDFATAPTSFICTIGSETTDNFNVVNDEGVFKLQAIQALTAGSYTVTVKADGNDEVSAAFTLTVNADPSEVPNWDISSLGYKFYKLTATESNGIYSASLYGGNDRGQANTLISTFNNIGANATVTIIGNSYKEEGLHITESASTNLGEIVFKGGTSKLDSVHIDGTENVDVYTINTESLTVSTPLYTSNPYSRLIDFYKDFYGENNKTYQNLAKVFNDAYSRLQSIVITNQIQFNTVALNGGAMIKLAGVRGAAIDAKAENDVFNIVKLGTNYDFIGGDGKADAISFASTTIKRAIINLGSQYIQYAVPGQLGTIRLHGDIEEVTGSCGSDNIISADNTTAIYGNGGSDIVTLKGRSDTSTTVNLNGRSQSVIARGDGAYTINITGGDHSIVNALSASGSASVTLTADGRNVNFHGSRGNDIVTITGNYAYINSGAGDDNIQVIGSNATVLAGSGDDYIFITVDADKNIVPRNNIVYGESGNDIINAGSTSGTNFFYAGQGNDMVVGGEGKDFIYGMSGNNVLVGNTGEDRIFGGTGRDIIMASGTEKMFNAENKEDFFKELFTDWCLDNDPDVDAAIELIGKESKADGSKDWLYRGSGTGNVIYTNSKSDRDFGNALTFSPFNDQLFDDLKDDDFSL